MFEFLTSENESKISVIEKKLGTYNAKPREVMKTILHCPTFNEELLELTHGRDRRVVEDLGKSGSGCVVHRKISWFQPCPSPGFGGDLRVTETQLGMKQGRNYVLTSELHFHDAPYSDYFNITNKLMLKSVSDGKQTEVEAVISVEWVKWTLLKWKIEERISTEWECNQEIKAGILGRRFKKVAQSSETNLP